MFLSLAMHFLLEIPKQKMVPVDPKKVSSIIVNESEGKNPEQYIVKDINLNFVDKVATTSILPTEM